MSAADLKAVQTIEQNSFHDSWTYETWLSELNSNMARYIVLEKDVAVIAFAGYWLIAGEAQVTRVAVVPAERGKGFGKIITEALLEAAWQDGATAITLEVRQSNAAALKVYADAGFVSSGIRPGYYQDNNEDAIIMWLYR
ncbi:MAG: ribosomal-protein-alanine N-acetyltransferase [Negativicutes bacterium]|nr:ribosomal-protein-alanine N-acetyltransferase [Negativicutes bacterium]